MNTETVKSKKKNLKLGKGLASLFEANTDESASFDMANLKSAVAKQTQTPKEEVKTVTGNTGQPYMIPVSRISVNQYQPRKIFKEKEVEELSLSIKENGILQPIVVSQREDGSYEIVSGERRFRATKKAGLEKIPAIIKRVTDREKLVFAIIENVQRSDLNCIEEALAYYQLMDEFKLTQEEVAKKIGKERSTIANFLRVLKLPRTVVELLQKEELSFGHAKILASIKEQEKCTRLARKAADEKMSVRQLETLIRAQNKPVKEKQAKEIDDKLYSLKETLEKSTGFHFDIKNKSNGSGTIYIKYSNEAEFNDIFEYILKK